MGKFSRDKSVNPLDEILVHDNPAGRSNSLVSLTDSAIRLDWHLSGGTICGAPWDGSKIAVVSAGAWQLPEALRSGSPQTYVAR